MLDDDGPFVLALLPGEGRPATNTRYGRHAMLLLCLIVVLLALGLAALRWGVDTRDGVHSREGERRRTWRGRW